jgi:uncharacterized protein Veg
MSSIRSGLAMMAKIKQEGKLKDQIGRRRWFEQTKDVIEDPSVAVVNFDDVADVLDTAKQELSDILENIAANDGLLTTCNKNEEQLKTLILSKIIIDAYTEWFKRWFGAK